MNITICLKIDILLIIYTATSLSNWLTFYLCYILNLRQYVFEILNRLTKAFG